MITKPPANGKMGVPGPGHGDHMHSFSVSLEDGVYWKVTASGELSRDIGWLEQGDILSLLTGQTSVRLLVDLRAVRGRPDIVASILQAEKLARRPDMYTHRIAVVDLDENQRWMTDEMLCFSNRGLPIRFFLNEADAAHWLSA
jgi:hypothetical protein